jgi:beta-lactamase class A
VESDNSAANLLLDAIGGPAALTAFFRRNGDRTSRLDRRELALNRPNGLMDTTSPRAMSGLLHRVLTGHGLDTVSRRKLEDWMAECSTGRARLRAGFPAAWRAGDKTGTGAAGETNDIAILRPPGRHAVFVAAYYVAPAIPHPQREAVLAGVGRIIARRVALDR